MKPQTRYTTARDGRVIAWAVMGDGPLDLLYVPASISATEQLWEHPTVMSFFERLSSFCRLILYDRRGSGMSERLQDAASLEEQVQRPVAHDRPRDHAAVTGRRISRLRLHAAEVTPARSW